MYIISSAEIVPEISDEIVELIKTPFKIHHVESSLDFFNHLQQVICLAPGMRLVYRTNFAGMYNDISQVVYFHHPKFAKQPQLEMIDILQFSLNTLPLLTQVFPHIHVYYEDDSFIPYLSDIGVSDKAPCDGDLDDDMLIDDFVQQRMYTDAARTKKSEIEEEDKRFAWLICCSSVFLIDTKLSKIFSSYNASLLPLISHMKNTSDSLIINDAFAKVSEESIYTDKNFKIDIATAHGHVCLL